MVLADVLDESAVAWTPGVRHHDPVERALCRSPAHQPDLHHRGLPPGRRTGPRPPLALASSPYRPGRFMPGGSFGSFMPLGALPFRPPPNPAIPIMDFIIFRACTNSFRR